MTKPKQQAAAKAEKYPRKAVPCKAGASDDERGRNYGELITAPELAAYRVVSIAQPQNLADDIDTPTLLATLRAQAAAVQGGSLAYPEAMLINQASALQALFVRLTERAMGQTHMPNFEAFMRMALRSQAQCRATLETLATIKNPPIVYARQANVTTGPQQINNGVAVPSQAREVESARTHLSGETHELLPDTRASGAASRINPTLETVGEVDRTQDGRG